MSIHITLQNAAETTESPTQAQLTCWVQAALTQSTQCFDSLTIRLVNSEESAALNKTYRQKEGPTNVLSFHYDETPGEEERHLGDLVVCAPLVEKEAKDQGISIESHWAHLIIHGTLHLLGYDHEEEAEAADMEARESQLMIQLNYEDPY